MKTYAILLVATFLLSFSGCAKKKDVCCQFENGCAKQKNKADCERLGGTVGTGDCTAKVEGQTVTYVCE